MKVFERRQSIVLMATNNEAIDVEILAKKYGVSAVTIRSDLNVLNQKRLLVRTHGGAVARNALTQELSIDEKKSEHYLIKKRIAAATAELISEDDTIILDSGTTTAEIALCLSTFNNLSVMTNGLNVAQNLLDADGVEVSLTGGTLRKKSLSFYGRQAEDSFKKYHFNKLILGGDGFDIKVGITTHFEHEATLNKMMCDVADQIIVAIDSSKFGRTSMYKIIDPFDIDVLVTDENIPDKYAQQLERNDVNIMIANKIK